MEEYSTETDYDLGLDDNWFEYLDGTKEEIDETFPRYYVENGDDWNVIDGLLPERRRSFKSEKFMVMCLSDTDSEGFFDYSLSSSTKASI